jgi:hypothetical protein
VFDNDLLEVADGDDDPVFACKVVSEGDVDCRQKNGNTQLINKVSCSFVGLESKYEKRPTRATFLLLRILSCGFDPLK